MTQLSFLTTLNDKSSLVTEIEALTRDDIETDLGIPSAETWPDRHKTHKYWGRKPANIVASYVSYFSKPGELVLDPFSGSGVTAIEAAIINRKSIGVDFNPFAVFLGDTSVNPPNVQEFSDAASEVMSAVEADVRKYFSSTCRQCGVSVIATSFSYDESGMARVQYACTSCGANEVAPSTSDDLERSKDIPSAPKGTPDGPIFFGWEMQKLRRRGATHWRDMFTRRNFYLAGRLREEVLKIPDLSVRNWMLITLTASIAQLTRMMMDGSYDAGGASWKINCYWLPKNSKELNPLQYFRNRVKRSRWAIEDIQSAKPSIGALAEFRSGDSRNLGIPSDSVDYVFTDPPYGGEGVQYGELSMLWCLWLGQDIDLSKEIAFNPYRKMNEDHYSSGLKDVFAEIYRVLKPGRWMTVTFANKDPEVWDALMKACKGPGFRLVTAVPMKRSAPSLTETNMKKAPKADLILTFQKPTSKHIYAVPTKVEYDFKGRVAEIAQRLNARGDYTAQDVFDRVTIDWFSWFYEDGERPNFMTPTLDAVEEALAS